MELASKGILVIHLAPPASDNGKSEADSLCTVPNEQQNMCWDPFSTRSGSDATETDDNTSVSSVEEAAAGTVAGRSGILNAAHAGVVIGLGALRAAAC